MASRMFDQKVERDLRARFVRSLSRSSGQRVFALKLKSMEATSF